ncbi:ATP-dependent DNA helicase [Microbacterium mangrovi]|uniref:DNA 3'-5' helicase n=1 Tax=Microbacterium mangrovi TaxID=1348253 RepID=A0A0B2A7M7_9MICO|nr:ATP-dependent helicase [Microbacterium mangrovi]KHK97552.1 ATP-dependent DNA helicase [Microbacterium mangrovi]
MSGSALDGLDDAQREAASALRGPVCVLAGAGTGKTRVITHRIAHGVETGAYTPNRVMAVTFTSKAAGEMRGRLHRLGVPGVAARTFHAAALSQLNFFWPTVAKDSAPGIVDNKVKLLAHAADSIGLDLDRPTLRDVAADIEWRKVTLRSLDAYAHARPGGIGGLPVERVVALQRAYEALKDERRQLDFEDVLLACAGMLEAEPRVAAAVREQYRHFTVDEYQDVSPLQNRLLDLWLGDRRDLCVVGDASQTIYSFTGADASFLLDFERRHPDARVVRLERSYRSAPTVLAVANELMRGRPGALRLTPARPQAEEAVPPRPSVTAYLDDELEARGVAQAVATQLKSGADPRQIAVLYRTHAQSLALVEALSAKHVATTVLGGRRFFDIPEVRQAVMAIRAAAVAPTTGSLVLSVRDVLRGLGLTDAPPPAGGALREAWEARAALLRLAEESPEDMTLRAFGDELQRRAKDQHEPTVRTVTLATLHAAKGLEWDHVHLVGMAEGLLPISYATTFEQVDEERRLAYVGITRAARTLSMSWARGGGRQERLPSRFLREIGTSTVDEVNMRRSTAGVRRPPASPPARRSPVR